MVGSDFPIISIQPEDFPLRLKEIPQVPVSLYVRGILPDLDTLCLAVVGSRNYSNYGKQVVEYLISGLKGYNIAIISGLALGIDGLAHKAALDAGLYTLAVPGSGIHDSVIGPRTNYQLAHHILESGGGLLSEFEPTFHATPWSFPQRNRIMVGLSHAVLVIEASEKSGTLITARLTVDYNRDLLVVPGNIFSENSSGPHQFLKLGATPVTAPEDILEALHIEIGTKLPKTASTFSSSEEKVLAALTEPRDRDALIRILTIDTQEANILLMSMELNGHIHESNGVFYKR
jgi:DNA processing protein